MFLPSLPAGSVGGGTSYPTPKEGLELLGCAGSGKKRALLEAIAAFALVADVSVGAPIATKTHTAGRQRLARASNLSSGSDACTAQ